MARLNEREPGRRAESIRLSIEPVVIRGELPVLSHLHPAPRMSRWVRHGSKSQTCQVTCVRRAPADEDGECESVCHPERQPVDTMHVVTIIVLMAYRDLREFIRAL